MESESYAGDLNLLASMLKGGGSGTGAGSLSLCSTVCLNKDFATCSPTSKSFFAELLQGRLREKPISFD